MFYLYVDDDVFVNVMFNTENIFLRLMVINSSLWITFLFVNDLMSVSLFNAVKIFIIVLE